MMFRRELAEKVVAGEKTVTRRAVSGNPRSPWYRKQCRYREGQIFTVNPGRGVPNIGRARVKKVRREHLGHLTLEEVRAEGFATVREFYDTFKAIHGKYDPTQLVWRLEFEAVPS